MEGALEACETAEQVLQQLKSFGVGIKSVNAALENTALLANLQAMFNGV